jgi:hypothetical protein
MYFEILVEDSSGAKLMEALVPKILGPDGESHSWRIHPYKGVGRLPKNMMAGTNAGHRLLLDQLPRLIRGFNNVPSTDAVIVVLDLDSIILDAAPRLTAIVNLAVEEVEAWYFGDRIALLQAYPRAKLAVLSKYVQDSICGTWEVLADAIYPGGSRALLSQGWPLPGQVKHEWAARIGPIMQTDRNTSQSFNNLVSKLRKWTD